MSETNEEKVKKLIIEANEALESHEFEKSNEICEKALLLDCEEPNIYLIQLLAKYKVTEIEDLKNCEVDYYSDVYKNLRFFAGKELNDDLDKALFDQEKPILSHQSVLQKIDYFFKSIINFISEELKVSNKKANSLSEYNKNHSVKTNMAQQDSLEVTKNDSVSSTSSFLTIICFSVEILALPFMALFSLGENRFLTFICLSVIIYFFFKKLAIIYDKPSISMNIKEISGEEDFVVVKYIVRILINLIFALIVFFISHLLFMLSSGFIIFDKFLLLGLFLGIIPPFIILLLYRNIYRFITNIKSLFKLLFK